MSVTIKGLAAHCGLSVSTVSKALNGYEDVSEETRTRVREAAEALGYRASAIARSLKTGHSFSLGVIYSEDTSSGFTHNYFSPILQAFKQGATRHGYDIIFIPENSGRTLLDHCLFRGVDGVLIVNTHYDTPEVEELSASGLPLVTIDHALEGHTCIRSENEEGMIALTRYILSRGHTRVAFISGGYNSEISDLRVRTFCETMKAAGHSVPPEYLPHGRFHDPSATRAATQQLLDLPDPPTCIVMPDDYAALGGMDAIRDAGLRIPRDLSIVGFDGVKLLQLCQPRLTTVEQDTVRIGELAAEYLIARIEQPEKDAPLIVPVPCRLIRGETVFTREI